MITILGKKYSKQNHVIGVGTCNTTLWTIYWKSLLDNYPINLRIYKQGKIIFRKNIKFGCFQYTQEIEKVTADDEERNLEHNFVKVERKTCMREL